MIGNEAKQALGCGALGSASLDLDGDGIKIGFGTRLLKFSPEARSARLRNEDGRRCLALWSIALRAPAPIRLLEQVEAAAAHWLRGEKVLAGLHLTFADLPCLKSSEDARRLKLAEHLLDNGFDPHGLLDELGLDSRCLDLRRDYDPEQPRVPAGSGQTSGQWTSAVAATAAAAIAASRSAEGALSEAGTLASGLFEAAGGQLVTGLAALVARIAGPASVLGAVVIPSPNDVASEGTVPGDPSLRYSLNGEDGTLRFHQDGDDGSQLIAVAQLGQGGIFYETETGVPVARALGGSVVFDPASLASIPSEIPVANIGARADAATTEEEPKLCPASSLDRLTYAKPPAVEYQAQISALNNPVRGALPKGWGVSLTNPATGRRVAFDDCREADGAMIEAKGPGYARMLRSSFFSERVLPERWTNQGSRQVSAAGVRDVDWFFAEDSAAEAAREVFGRREALKRIKVLHVPAGHP